MRGSPVHRALVMLALLLAAAFPLWRLTHATATTMAPSIAAPASTVHAVTIDVQFAHPPVRWSLQYLGKPLGEWTTPHETLSPLIPFPTEGIDLQVRAEWPAGTPLTAMRVRVTPQDGTVRENTVWGEHRLDEVLTFR